MNKQNVCYICKKEFSDDKKKSEIVVIFLVNIEELSIMFTI